MADEIPVTAGLTVDRGDRPLGASLGADQRRRLHTFIANQSSEPIPVFITDGSPQVSEIVFNAVSSLASGLSYDVLVYTVPPTQTFALTRILASGDNIANFDVSVDGSVIARRRTWFGGDLSTEFNFSGFPQSGIIFNSGQVIKLTVTNFRPTTADFEGTLMGVLIG